MQKFLGYGIHAYKLSLSQVFLWHVYPVPVASADIQFLIFLLHHDRFSEYKSCDFVHAKTGGCMWLVRLMRECILVC